MAHESWRKARAIQAAAQRKELLRRAKRLVDLADEGWTRAEIQAEYGWTPEQQRYALKVARRAA